MGINEFLKTILEWIYGFVGNYGWAVVLFTLLVRLIVMPFDYKSRVGMPPCRQNSRRSTKKTRTR